MQAISLPRQIVMNSDNTLSFPPLQEVSQLRSGATTCYDKFDICQLTSPLPFILASFSNIWTIPAETWSTMTLATSLIHWPSVWIYAARMPNALLGSSRRLRPFEISRYISIMITPQGPFNNCPGGIPCCYLKNIIMPSNPNNLTMVSCLHDFSIYWRI